MALPRPLAGFKGHCFSRKGGKKEEKRKEKETEGREGEKKE